jgi:hypothetical protein
MKPPMVYDDTMPNSHKIIRITLIVQSMLNLLFDYQAVFNRFHARNFFRYFFSFFRLIA